MSKQRHIYCIEGNWNINPRNKQSTRPILDILYHSCNIKYVYYKCNTREEFFEALRRYKFSRYKNYSILYIAFHGKPNGICIGREFVTLAEISEVLSRNLTDFVVHFGSCSTLRTKRLNIDDFLTKTGASMISGYRKQVDFVESTAWEMIWFQSLQDNRIPKAKSLPRIADDLNFSIIIAK